MGFMTNTAAGGDFKVYCKYNAKAGRWYTKEDKQEAEDFEVTNMTAIFDIPNIKTGWFLFTPGTAPVKQFDPSLSESSPKPGDDFKRGFEVDLYSEKNLLGLREFASTAGIVIEGMNALYDLWEAAPESKTDKLPVVKCAGVTPVTNKHGTNYQPKFEIVGWADRPAAMAGVPAKVEVAAKPTPKADPVPVAADDDDEPIF